MVQQEQPRRWPFSDWPLRWWGR